MGNKPNLARTALGLFLAEHDPGALASIEVLRRDISAWLGYIPTTFPHYTRHSVEHSDEVVAQMSKFLFRDEPLTPVLDLTSTEVTILCAAAYLHDAGMVVSDDQKVQLLQSSDWRQWVAGPARKRWEAIEELREGADPADQTIRNYLADLQTRHLIAEYVRRTHHLRVAEVLIENPQFLARAALEDPDLVRTIRDVSIAHGLDADALEDEERYPTRRDVRGDRVNVRFIALCLRLGDLLDLSTDRACPLLMNAVSPLPPTSYAHWSQYSRITQRLTAPDRIEIFAQCLTQEEHRTLADWFSWIEKEIVTASLLAKKFARHRGWEPPQVITKVEPAEEAKYLPRKWVFELDPEAITEHLATSAYDHPQAFVRELLQNAIDATRCRLYADLQKGEGTRPRVPTDVPSDVRDQYPILVSTEEVELKNELSGTLERRQAITVEDFGIGMDSDVIERYFLQLGRSFYRSEEFRRQFGFVPTSRFGLGFLSVFAESDHVVVETRKPTSLRDDGAIRMLLTGPRTYLLTERGSRSSAGTRVQVVLRRPLEKGSLTELIRAWCRRVEFPIRVSEGQQSTEIEAERPDDFVQEVPDLSQEAASFAIRAFPIDTSGLQGELYVFARLTQRGEDWTAMNWATDTYANMYPRAVVPRLPTNLWCLHGITVDEGPSWRGHAHRLDERSTRPRSIGRSASRIAMANHLSEDPRLQRLWTDLVLRHLAESPSARGSDAWRYKQRLFEHFAAYGSWSSIPGAIPIHRDGKPDAISLSEAVTHEEIRALCVHRDRFLRRTVASVRSGLAEEVSLQYGITLVDHDIDKISSIHRDALFQDRVLERVEPVEPGVVAAIWRRGKPDRWNVRGDGPTELTRFWEPQRIGLELHLTTNNVLGHLAMNGAHPFVQWLQRVRFAGANRRHGLTHGSADQIVQLASVPIRFAGFKLGELIDYLSRWRDTDIPTELDPPIESVNAQSFDISI